MSDLIDRQAAIEAIEDLPNCYNGFSDTYDKSCIIGVLEELPSAQPLSAWGGNPLNIELPSAQPEPPTHGSISAKTVQKQCNRTIDDCISRQAAIDVLEWFTQTDTLGFTPRQIVEALPSAQPEHRLNEWCTDCKEYDHEKNCCPRFNRVIRTTLQDAQRTGRWIEDSGNIACSECHIIWLHRRTAFCPNCGAEMIGETNVE